MSFIIYNDTYSLSELVKNVHQIPHLNSHLKQESNDWDITIDSQWNSYTKSVLRLPIILLLIGIFLIFIYLVVIFCCYKKSTNDYESLIPYIRNSNKTSKKMVTRILIIVSISIILINQMVIVGNNFLTHGINTGRDNLNSLDTIFVNLNDYGEELTNESNNLQSDISNSCTTCSNACLLLPSISDLNSYIDNYLSYIEDIPNQCDDIENHLNLYGSFYKNIIIWLMYSLIIASTVIYGIGIYKSKINFVRAGLCCTNTIMICLLIICFAVMILLMLSADFCMSPTENLLKVIPSGDTYDTVYYYTTCDGINPLTTELDDALSYIHDLEIALQALLKQPGDCSDVDSQQYLTSSLNDANMIDYTLIETKSSLSCPYIQNYYQNILNDSICDDVFIGIYIIWLGFYVSIGFIYIASWFVWYLYPKGRLDYDEDGHQMPLIIGSDQINTLHNNNNTSTSNNSIYSPIPTNDNTYSRASAPSLYNETEDNDEIIYAFSSPSDINNDLIAISNNNETNNINDFDYLESSNIAIAKPIL